MTQRQYAPGIRPRPRFAHLPPDLPPPDDTFTRGPARCPQPMVRDPLLQRKGNAPPSSSELERWAKGMPGRGAAALPAPLAPADVQQLTEREAQLQARAAQIAPADLSDDEWLALLADLGYSTTTTTRSRPSSR